MAGKKVEGKLDQVKGRVRETVGKVTGNKSTELKGKAQHLRRPSHCPDIRWWGIYRPLPSRNLPGRTLARAFYSN
jgi:hypothetical protein